MTSKFINQAHRSVMSTLAALILTASIPQAAFAASDAGIWRVDAAKSKFNSSSATLTIKRVDAARSPAADSFIVISGAGVYRMMGASASDHSGLKPVDVANMTRTGEAVLIGTNPRSLDTCGFKCQGGLDESVTTITFAVVKSGEKQIRDMLALDQDE
jgi:hypothetical protein